ncbi:MAG: aminoacyl-histidine dipeptidase [Myroides sp.]|nr:aminoacyl-histidine dipeptidase [Myroides sp.]
MSQDIRNLEPLPLWNHFADLNAVPRPSKKEERVIAFMKKFGEDLGLETIVDEVGNVIIKKPATSGMENRKTIVLQSHLDMVHQKNNDTDFDFDTQGIDMYVDGDWVRAKGTTLGADNGIGVATIMAVLASTEMQHPAIEALFTIDEETGMTGAMGLKGGLLQGEILLNLDTEEDDEIDIGCAGGVDVTAKATYEEEETPDGSVGYRITVKGLKGGHSGMDIHKGLGNANKIMNRLLFNGFDSFGLQIATINGGSLRNAIPRESVTEVIIAKMYDESFVFDMLPLVNEIKAELATTEPNLEILFEKLDTMPTKVVPPAAQYYLLRSLYTAHNGVYRMSADFADLVETSNNIAKVTVSGGSIQIQCLTRSSVETSKFDLANSLRAAFELMGCEVEFSGSYPGWTPNPNSSILKVLDELYEKQNGKKANVVACHAGLECGILGTNYPNMEMISFGPTIRGAHSPEERVSISSVQKYWKFFEEILKNIPA